MDLAHRISTDPIDLALEDACLELLNTFPADGTPFPWDRYSKIRFHVRVREFQTAEGSEKRVEYAEGGLDRVWYLLLDAASGRSRLHRVAMLLALREMVSWTEDPEFRAKNYDRM